MRTLPKQSRVPLAGYGLLADGLVMIEAPGSGATARIGIDDGTTRGSLSLTPLAQGILLRGGTQTPIGKGNEADWRIAGRSVFRSKLYLDVLDGFTPARDNGTVVFQP